MTTGSASSSAVLPFRARTPDLSVRFRAMASEITVWVVDPLPGAAEAIRRAEEVFHRVERACSRFDPSSPLMRANAAPRDWHSVPAELFDALAEAAAAHVATDGLFDPRVLQALVALGYDRSLLFAESSDARGPDTGWRAGSQPEPSGQAPRTPWAPRFDEALRSVSLGDQPVDLGGIGKGLAVRWARDTLLGAGRAALVEAGGDCAVVGAGPEGAGWNVGVEDPRGGDEPIAVLCIADLACATSSVRVRRWRSRGRAVHHLIDPRTGQPGGAGLVAVTVVGPDPALAEVWSKALFLTGSAGIADRAAGSGLAALWVGVDGSIASTSAMAPFLLWSASDVR